MNDYRYILEPGSKKHRCPVCHKKKYVRFVDTETGEYLPIEYGRCDRENKCGYFVNPYSDGYAKKIWKEENGRQSNWKPSKKRFHKPPPRRKTIFFPYEVFKKTRSGYKQNNFIENLLSNVPFPFEISDVEKVISQYHLGTIKKGYRAGAITFPFIDIDDNVRAIQVKQFDEHNHTTGTDFLHSIIEKHYKRKDKPLPDWLPPYLKQEKRVSCLFGEHLLKKHPHNPIALVEAPKTAIYGTLYFGFPDAPTNLLWLAVYNLSSLNFDKIKVLEGRDVFLFPDLSKSGHAYKQWSDKAKDFESRLRDTVFKVSDLLERSAMQTDRKQGNDIADYLIKLDWRQFRKQETERAENKEIEVSKVEDVRDNIPDCQKYDPTFEKWLKEALAYERLMTEREEFINHK